MIEENEKVQINASNKFINTFIFGSISGALSTFLLQPFDRLRTISQQLDNRKLSILTIFKRTALPNYNGNPLSLWKGLTPSLIRVIPGAAIYFGCIEIASSKLKNRAENFEKFNNFLIGFTSRAIAGIILQPLTVIKTQSESSLYKKINLTQTFKSINNKKKFFSLWRGLIPKILRDASFSGIYLLFYRSGYDFIKQTEKKEKDKSFFEKFLDNDFLLRFFVGLNSGALACLITQPFDVLKTMVILYPTKFSSTSKSFLYIYQNINIKTIFRGFSLRAGKQTIGTALSWALYEQIVKMKTNV